MCRISEIHEIYMDLWGYMRIHHDIYMNFGYMDFAQDLLGFIWICEDLHGSMGIHEFVVFMKICKDSCYLHGFARFLRICMDLW